MPLFVARSGFRQEIAEWNKSDRIDLLDSSDDETGGYGRCAIRPRVNVLGMELTILVTTKMNQKTLTLIVSILFATVLAAGGCGNRPARPDGISQVHS
jgi:hypothetical protein